MAKKTSQKKTAAKKKNIDIFERIAKVQHSVASAVKLGGLGDEYAYTFAYEKDVMAEVKPLTEQHGILILCDVLESMELANNIIKVRMAYTLVNTDHTTDRWTSHMEGTGANMNEEGGLDGKGLARAITMANKYYLAKTFQIPIGGDAESEKRDAAKKEGKGAELKKEDAGRAFISAKKLVSSSRNAAGLQLYIKQLDINKLFDKDQKKELVQLAEAQIAKLTPKKKNAK